MKRASQGDYRDPVPPVGEALPRPFWSIMIPTFNSGAFLRQTLASVLEQDEGPERMQIAVVDDASDKDDPAQVVAELGKGRVDLLRQPHNVGHIGNFHTCLAASRGMVVHLLHGDDLVEPGFYRALEQGMRDERIGAAFCASRYIDAWGKVLGVTPPVAAAAGPLVAPAEQLALEQRVMTPSIVVRRSVYETLGGFDRRLRCSEDWEMWVRIAASYPVWYEPRPLARYRLHQNSNTGRHLASAEDMAFTRRAIAIFSSYLPAEARDRIVRDARRTYARTALGTARTLLAEDQRKGARAQLREAVLLDPSPGTLTSAAGVLARSLRSRPSAAR
jgi:glycosyltransferase involved in cell wall biosynthesis